MVIGDDRMSTEPYAAVCVCVCVGVGVCMCVCVCTCVCVCVCLCVCYGRLYQRTCLEASVEAFQFLCCCF